MQKKEFMRKHRGKHSRMNDVQTAVTPWMNAAFSSV